jgi:predicted nucleic acid-binding protein
MLPKTPDALHVATAILSDCVLFLTNDYAFRRVSKLNVVILDEVSGLDTSE